MCQISIFCGTLSYGLFENPAPELISSKNTNFVGVCRRGIPRVGISHWGGIFHVGIFRRKDFSEGRFFMWAYIWRGFILYSIFVYRFFGHSNTCTKFLLFYTQRENKTKILRFKYQSPKKSLTLTREISELIYLNVDLAAVKSKDF